MHYFVRIAVETFGNNTDPVSGLALKKHQCLKCKHAFLNGFELRPTPSSICCVTVRLHFSTTTQSDSAFFRPSVFNVQNQIFHLFIEEVASENSNKGVVC